MMEHLLEGIRSVGQYRTLLAIGLPVLGGALVVATDVWMPRGKAKGLLTGAYLLLTALGVACLACAALVLVAGEPRRVIVPLMIPGIALTAVMGSLTPAILRAYQDFEFRKLAAEIFRRS